MNQQSKHKSLPPKKIIPKHNEFKDIEHCPQAIKQIISNSNASHTKNFHKSAEKDHQQPQEKKHLHSTVQQYNQNVGKMFTSTKYGVAYMQKKVMHNIDQL
ncbi:unnamed protein product (macronuclear) [Paramecium tetraurelia]|uniref:Uncharacterized protein n=1 Tax=Paramecium tetraurelia TaxID=5888 RepID=A0DX78_PARTE|nr:uncharacterized protein GSPATT00021277001 [Paramecium tetraurelia]CAK87645.1 unnamed protein product [Paramecium tetraurelia]|eukprot:XP_001455042.1 hypothetical protein (macronuclear) [Paramecium tetraurelia strain d4-2]